MDKLHMDTAIRWYNDIMNQVGYEHRTIGEPLSEDTENWNIRDMVAEMDYVLSTYYEVGHCNEEMRHSEEEIERRSWRNETGRMKRFLKKYKQYIGGVVCTAGHCSRFDNRKEVR